MVNTFSLKNIFLPDERQFIIDNFGFDNAKTVEIDDALHKAFADYIFNSLSEISGDETERRQLYIEANYHLEKAEKLLQGMPHPAGKMSYRIAKMSSTLEKLIEGNDNFAAEKANRFLEKNLMRRLRDVWQSNTSAPFRPGGDDSGKSPRDFVMFCFKTVSEKYPDIQWMRDVDLKLIDIMIKSAR